MTRRKPPSPPRRPPAANAPHRALTSSGEWIGTRQALAIPHGAEHLGPTDVTLWMADGLLLDATPIPASAPKKALADGLTRALAKGRVPPPRAVRVTDEGSAAAVRKIVGPSVPVTVAPAPELDAVLDDLVQTLAGAVDTPTQLELLSLGDDFPDAVARFFERAAALYRTQPWQIIPSNDDVLLVDAPAVGLREVCVCVLGQGHEQYGILWVDSLDDYLRFRDTDERNVSAGPRVELRSVSYEHLESLPPPQRRELALRHWEVAGPAALPFPLHTLADGRQVAFDLDDLRAATALCDALTRFFTEHGSALRMNRAPATWTCRLDASPDGATVTVRYPHPESRARTPTSLLDDEERATAEFLGAWNPDFDQRSPDEIRGTLDEMAFAILGRRPTRHDGPSLSELGTSLPLMWAALWRPMKDGRTGLVRVGADPRFRGATLDRARRRLASARVLFAEALSVDLARGTLIVRDLIDGGRYEVMGPPHEWLHKVSRWMRVFAVALPRDDGRWVFPSVSIAAPEFEQIDVPRFLTRLRETLAAMGKSPRDVDPQSPRAGLLRHLGIAHGVLLRMLDEARRAPRPKRFLANSDGDCVEFHDVEVQLGSTLKAVTAALDAAPDFERTDRAQWDRVDRARTSVTPEGETLAQLAREGRRWVVRASSEGRVERMLDRLAEVLGERPRERTRTVHAPWRTDPTIARTKDEAQETDVVAYGPMRVRSDAEGRAVAAEMPLATLRRMLDEEVPAVGGVPRERVKTDEGRKAVERWLRGAEAQGLPEESPEGRMLDLDPLRKELGLPTVV